MPARNVDLVNISHHYGSLVAVDDVTMSVPDKSFFSFLGPSGCGKTTLLRIIAGFIEPSSGQVLIGSRDMQGIPPNHRPTAMIFQNLALFPRMKVWENVGFAFEVQGIARKRRRIIAEALLDRVALPGVADKYPDDLSGGQRQRVAIARALAVEPDVLLLDEPLSALDLKLRQKMVAELRTIQKQTDVTFIYITHDQGEAMAMSDQIAVMTEGGIQQIGTPRQIYNEPDTAFVAMFVGENNRLQGAVKRTGHDHAILSTPVGEFIGCLGSAELSPGDDAWLFVRPERCVMGDTTLDNRVCGRLVRQDFDGPSEICILQIEGRDFKVIYPQGLHQCHVGEQTQVTFRKEHALIMSPGVSAHD
jgi:spermidine/putrescine transport system ATP-binding protein